MAKTANSRKKPYILSFVAARSGTGKTTLIEKLITILTSKGYRIGALKHNSHEFEMDHKGKDSYRFTHAGAAEVIVASKDRLGMVRTLQEELEANQIVNMFDDVDIIIIEGFRNNEYPKIEIHRKCIDDRLLCNSPYYHGFIAVASDEKLNVDLEVLDINDAEYIAGWIAKKAGEFLKSEEDK